MISCLQFVLIAKYVADLGIYTRVTSVLCNELPVSKVTRSIQTECEKKTKNVLVPVGMLKESCIT